MSSRSYDTITYEVDGHTATITLNRPDALNALSPHMVTELRDAYDAAENDDDVWVLIVTGTGRAFCTGADVKAIPGDGKVINDRPYLSTYEQWEAPQEGTPVLVAGASDWTILGLLPELLLNSRSRTTAPSCCGTEANCPAFPLGYLSKSAGFERFHGQMGRFSEFYR